MNISSIKRYIYDVNYELLDCFGMQMHEVNNLEQNKNETNEEYEKRLKDILIDGLERVIFYYELEGAKSSWAIEILKEINSD